MHDRYELEDVCLAALFFSLVEVRLPQNGHAASSAEGSDSPYCSTLQERSVSGTAPPRHSLYEMQLPPSAKGPRPSLHVPRGQVAQNLCLIVAAFVVW